MLKVSALPSAFCSHRTPTPRRGLFHTPAPSPEADYCCLFLRVRFIWGQGELKKRFYPFHLWQLAESCHVSVVFLGRKGFSIPFPKVQTSVLYWFGILDPFPALLSGEDGFCFYPSPKSSTFLPAPVGMKGESLISSRGKRGFFLFSFLFFASTLSPEALGMTAFVAQLQ